MYKFSIKLICIVCIYIYYKSIHSLMRARVITYFDIHIHIDYMMCLVYKLYVHN